MGFFSKKKEVDIARSDENKERMRKLFEQTVEEHEGYNIVYGYSSSVKNSNYILARKTTFRYVSMIIGYRKSDMSIVILQTTPDLDGCSDPEIFKPSDLKKVKFDDSKAQFVLQHAGGFTAGSTRFSVGPTNAGDVLAYVYQNDEFMDWYEFFNNLKSQL